MDVCIRPTKLTGHVTPPPSKSEAHRLLIAAALAKGESSVTNVALSQDILATLGCIETLGCKVKQVAKGEYLIRGVERVATRSEDAPLPVFDCGESGSTLRFFIPIALAVCGGGEFIGRGRLMQRPLTPYFNLFDRLGIAYELDGERLRVEGLLTPGDYALPGDISSQFFTGLLFALPLLNGPSRLISTTQLESRDYLAMTLRVMQLAGVSVAEEENAFTITPGAYATVTRTVEADWSQAGFWYAAKHLGCDLEICGTDLSSAQGDKQIAELAQQLAKPGDVTIDLSVCPDLLPPLAVIAAVREGITYFVNGARLRLKESDRLATTAAMLRALGAHAEEGETTLTVYGQPTLTGGMVDGANDHRIVMAAAVAACACAEPVTITDAQAVAKSYPDFFDVYAGLGGSVHVI